MRLHVEPLSSVVVEKRDTLKKNIPGARDASASRAGVVPRCVFVAVM
jgi:hypothetical protein